MSKNTQNIVVALAAISLSLVYVLDSKGDLHTLKPAQLAEVTKDPTLLANMPTLKHNPTNVHGKGLARLSDQARRPLYVEVVGEDGLSTFNETLITPAPEAKTRVAGAKKEKAVKAEGPRTIYVIDEVDQLRSLDPEQFKAAQDDITTLAFCKTLKHNPTCVEKSLLQGGRISTEDLDRPMYWVRNGKLQRVWSSEEVKLEFQKAAADLKAATKAADALSKVANKKLRKSNVATEVTAEVEAKVVA